MATFKAYEKIKKVKDAQTCNELCTESKENGDGCQYFNFKVNSSLNWIELFYSPSKFWVDNIISSFRITAVNPRECVISWELKQRRRTITILVQKDVLFTKIKWIEFIVDWSWELYLNIFYYLIKIGIKLLKSFILSDKRFHILQSQVLTISF